MSAATPIYLDHHATTPLDPAVLEAMMPYLTGRFGNPASRSHAFGWQADEAVEAAREQVASVLGARPQEIVWTSGATESINLAIKGVAEAYAEQGRHLITSTVEHKAVSGACQFLEARGFEVTYLEVDAQGLISPEALEAALRPDTILVSLIHAQNEIGTLQPIQAIGARVKAHGALFHVDAAQSYGKVPIDVDAMGIDLLSLSAHKLYGPKGIGALYLRRRPRVRLVVQTHGASQENGLRPGTLNVPGIVGLGEAARLAAAHMAEETARLTRLRERLWQTLAANLEALQLNGHPTERLPGNLSVSFSFVDAEALMARMPSIAVSSASACLGGSMLPSATLKACGLSDALALSTLRFGLGRGTTEPEIDEVAARTIEAVRQLRDASPVYALWKSGGDVAALQGLAL